MSNWFECKVKYQKLDNLGKVKSVSEPYLVDAVSFTEAESRINKEMEPYISGEFTVTNMKVANYADIIQSETGDRWFKCKVSYITIDEEKGLERKTNSYMLIKASSVKDAYDKLENDMRNTVSDYEISSIQESPILEIFPYNYEQKTDGLHQQIEDESVSNDLEDFRSEFEDESEEEEIELDDNLLDDEEMGDDEDEA